MTRSLTKAFHLLYRRVELPYITHQLFVAVTFNWEIKGYSDDFLGQGGANLYIDLKFISLLVGVCSDTTSRKSCQTCVYNVHIHFIFSYSVSVSKCSHMTHLACALPLFVCHVSSAGTGWPALFRCLRTNQAPAQFGGHGAHQLLPIIVIHVCSQKNISGSPQHTNIHIRRTLRIKSTRYLMSRQIGYLCENRYMCI